MLDTKETVWNFQDNISGNAKAHLQISRMIWQLFQKNPKNRVFPKILRKVEHFKICYLRTC